MTVPSVPGAGVAVYDQNGQCVFNSLWGEGTSVQLPANGYLMFSGTVGARFLIHMQASQAAA